MVNKSLYHVALVNVSRNAFFSSRSKKNIFFDVDIVVKNKSKCGFSWYVLLRLVFTSDGVGVGVVVGVIRELMT